MKVKLFILFIFSQELFAFMSPQYFMSKMTLSNAKNMMLSPLHPERKIAQGIRLMEEMGTLMEYSITHMSQKSSRAIRPTRSNLR